MLYAFAQWRRGFKPRLGQRLWDFRPRTVTTHTQPNSSHQPAPPQHTPVNPHTESHTGFPPLPTAALTTDSAAISPAFARGPITHPPMPHSHTDSHSVTHTHTHSVESFPPLFAATGEPSRASQTAPTALCTTLSTVHTLYIPLTSTLGSTHHETAASHSSLAHSGLAVSPFTLRWA